MTGALALTWLETVCSESHDSTSGGVRCLKSDNARYFHRGRNWGSQSYR